MNGTSNLTPARFIRMVGEWMDAGGYMVPVRLCSNGGDGWVGVVGRGGGMSIVCHYDHSGRCENFQLGHEVFPPNEYFPPTEQGLTDALIELACRMGEGK